MPALLTQLVTHVASSVKEGGSPPFAQAVGGGGSRSITSDSDTEKTFFFTFALARRGAGRGSRCGTSVRPSAEMAGVSQQVRDVSSSISVSSRTHAEYLEAMYAAVQGVVHWAGHFV